ncbi:AMP-binding protein [Lentzea sp. HUAS12]|uniref:AMP-binding protein n=1 Tax=Lentzea sp. HUAS12 TaxID=2951806 RepID=UPI0020A16F42|nr:AMP-binding protein [Lentzea sp. HUAS12]USX55488.1 AMP-binding protein [Lentzea sp. HUAS12]
MTTYGQWTTNLAESVWQDATSHRTALIEHSSGRSYHYVELKQAVERFAAALRPRLRGPDEVLALVCDNTTEFVVAYHGTLLAGGVVLPLEPLGTPDEWQPVLERCRVVHVVAPAKVWRQLSALPAAASVRSVVLLDDVSSDDLTVGWHEWLNGPAAAAAPAAGDERPALLATSSGSLGLPKQIVLTHRNLVSNLDQIGAVHRIAADDVVLATTPLRHIYGMQMAMNPTLRAGGTLVTVRTPFNIDDLVEVIETQKITVAYLVPSILAELARRGGTGGRDTSSLRLVYSGGAPLPANVAQSCARLLGVPVVQGYGMTEAGCTFAPPDGIPPVPTSIGKALPDTEIRLVDPATGLDGETGEIWVRGPQVSPGFLGEDGTVHGLADGERWLHTGDIARRERDGHVTIIGRIKQLIKYKGHQIAPAELESVLLSHPDVADAVVTGAPDEVAGEIPVAYVVLSGPVALSEVTDFVACRVAPYKKIRSITAVDRIPRSAVGKALVHQVNDVGAGGTR